jgi:small-conductance mechanosensitive channel
LSYVVSWLIQAFLDVEVMTPRNMEHGVKFAIKTLVHYSLIFLGFLVAISVAGIDMSKFAVLAGALGVGIGFGLQNIVNNFISGLILLFERPVKIGDMIAIDNQLGRITRIGLRSTVVETYDRAEVIVPNAELISERVTNWTFTSNMARITLPVGVAYGTPLERVLSALQVVAREHAEVLRDPEPVALFIEFGDSSINFELRAWIGDVNERLRIRSELGLAIDEAFRKNGITIPFPQRDLHLQSVAPNLLDSLHPGNQGAAKITEDSAE